MKALIIVAVIAVLLIAGTFGVMALNKDAPTQTATTIAKTTCSSCGNQCTATSNCGKATCGAVSGTGSCGCNKG